MKTKYLWLALILAVVAATVLLFILPIQKRATCCGIDRIPLLRLKPLRMTVTKSLDDDILYTGRVHFYIVYGAVAKHAIDKMGGNVYFAPDAHRLILFDPDERSDAVLMADVGEIDFMVLGGQTAIGMARNWDGATFQYFGTSSLAIYLNMTDVRT